MQICNLFPAQYSDKETLRTLYLQIVTSDLLWGWCLLEDYCIYKDKRRLCRCLQYLPLDNLKVVKLYIYHKFALPLYFEMYVSECTAGIWERWTVFFTLRKRNARNDWIILNRNKISEATDTIIVCHKVYFNVFRGIRTCKDDNPLCSGNLDLLKCWCINSSK